MLQASIRMTIHALALMPSALHILEADSMLQAVYDVATNQLPAAGTFCCALAQKGRATSHFCFCSLWATFQRFRT